MIETKKKDLKVNGSAVKAVPFPDGGSNAAKKYMEALFDASKAARSAQLEAAYEKSNADLREAERQSKAIFEDQKRQADARAQQANANYNRMANAYGVNSGAVGQAALIRNNQAQTNMGDIRRAYDQNNQALERQKRELEIDRQYDMQQLIANNEYQKGKAMYDEAVRLDNLRQQQAMAQREANAELLAKQVKASLKQKEEEAKAAAKAAKAAANSKGQTLDDETEVELINEYLKEVGITDFEATAGMPIEAYEWLIKEAERIENQKHANGQE